MDLTRSMNLSYDDGLQHLRKSCSRFHESGKYVSFASDFEINDVSKESVEATKKQRDFYLDIAFGLIDTTAEESYNLVRRGSFYVNRGKINEYSDLLDSGNIIHCGVLKKGKKLHGLWNKRFITIIKGELSWYDSVEDYHTIKDNPKDSKESGNKTNHLFHTNNNILYDFLNIDSSTKKKIIPLTNDLKFGIVPDGKPTLFELVYRKGDKLKCRYFKGLDDKDRDIWIRAIQQAIVGKVEKDFALDITVFKEITSSVSNVSDQQQYLIELSKLPEKIHVPIAWLHDTLKQCSKDTSQVMKDLARDQVIINGVLYPPDRAADVVVDMMNYFMECDVKLDESLKLAKYILEQTIRTYSAGDIYEAVNKLMVNTDYANLMPTYLTAPPLDYTIQKKESLYIEMTTSMSFNLVDINSDEGDILLNIDAAFYFKCWYINGKEDGYVDIKINKVSNDLKNKFDK